MKKILVLTILILCAWSGYAQITQEMYDKKVEEIANLKKKLEDAATNNNSTVGNYQILLKFCQDTINIFKRELSDLKEYKKLKKVFDTQLSTKSDSIYSLKNQLLEREKQITTTRQQGNQKAHEEKEKGKVEALVNIANTYKNKLFDELIKVSTKESVARDMQLVGNNTEVKTILNDLQIYFNVEELLAKRFDAVQIKNAQTQLSQIKRQSKLLDALKDDVEFYQDFNNALKETIIKIIKLDDKTLAADDSGIQKSKFNDIIIILTDYMYNYYDYAKYPYLSDIVIEIIKSKKPNADADITDLLIKLE